MSAGIERVDRLSRLPAMPNLAVIINCGTRWVSTLALVSLRARSDWPILVIDCESKDGSRAHFEQLSRRHGLHFHWLDWPLRPHGRTLDRLFDEVPAGQVLLVDSDVEIRDAAVLAAMQESLAADPSAYGAGFLHGPEWMGEAHGLPPHVGWYAQRMWIPLVLLRTAAIREARAVGESFLQRREFREIAGHPGLSRALGLRFWIPGLRGLRRRGDGTPEHAAFVEFDTGAAMHRCLAGFDHGLATPSRDLLCQVHHYHGVSRAQRRWRPRKLAERLHLAGMANDVAQDAIIDEVRARLARVYAIDLAALDRAWPTDCHESTGKESLE